jgi:hypothetical protein
MPQQWRSTWVGSSTDVSAVKQEATQAWKSKSSVGYGLELLWYEQLDHGQVFPYENTRRPVIRAISVNSDTGRNFPAQLT